MTQNFEGWLGHNPESADGNMKWGTFEPKKWTEDDVDIKITHCGICGTDIHVLRSDWGTSYREFRPNTLNFLKQVTDPYVPQKHAASVMRLLEMPSVSAKTSRRSMLATVLALGPRHGLATNPTAKNAAQGAPITALALFRPTTRHSRTMRASPMAASARTIGLTADSS